MKYIEWIYKIIILFIFFVAGLLIISIFPVTGNIKFFVVQSGSMSPAIKTGSIAMIKPATDYKKGDIITYGPANKKKSPTTHRVIDTKITNGLLAYITKGDANDTPDQKEILKSDVIGRVLFCVPYIGFLVDFAKTPLGFVLLVIIPAVAIIYDEAKKVLTEVKKIKSLKITSQPGEPEQKI